VCIINADKAAHSAHKHTAAHLSERMLAQQHAARTYYAGYEESYSQPKQRIELK
jgi:hypothetical protein